MDFEMLERFPNLRKRDKRDKLTDFDQFYIDPTITSSFRSSSYQNGYKEGLKAGFESYKKSFDSLLNYLTKISTLLNQKGYILCDPDYNNLLSLRDIVNNRLLSFDNMSKLFTLMDNNVFLLIFTSLTNQDLNNCALVCKKFHKIIADNFVKLYKFSDIFKEVCNFFRVQPVFGDRHLFLSDCKDKPFWFFASMAIQEKMVKHLIEENVKAYLQKTGTLREKFVVSSKEKHEGLKVLPFDNVFVTKEITIDFNVKDIFRDQCQVLFFGVFNSKEVFVEELHSNIEWPTEVTSSSFLKGFIFSSKAISFTYLLSPP